MGYFRQALKGVSWMGTLRVSTRAVAFIKIAILARILSPEEFGVFGIASLVLAFLEVITETGINALLIQEDSDIKDILNSAWVISIIRGFFISLLLFVSAIPITHFLNSPSSKNLLLLISVIPLFRGFINPAIVSFQKTLQFNKEFYLRSMIYIVDATVSISLAFILKSAVALVWGMLSGVLVEIALSHFIVNPKPKFLVNRKDVRDIMKRGKWITLNGIFNYFYQQGDDIVVSKLLGTYALGLYQVAYKVSTLPISESGEVLHKVTFPIFVKIGGDKSRLKKAYLKVVLTTSAITIPFGILLILFTRQMVVLFLGYKWIEIIPVIKILAIFGIIRSISGTSAALFLAIKKQNYITYVLLVGFLGLIISIIPLTIRYGILGAGYSALIGWIFAVPLTIYLLVKVFRSS